ncbi:hypothetical protein V8E51_003074 [Hyaloscypha variabilis]
MATISGDTRNPKVELRCIAVGEETYQVRYLLDLLCQVWQDAAGGPGELSWSHEDTKIMMAAPQPYTIWWSNRRSADTQLREIQRGLHWANPRGNRSRRRYLRFTDTDGNDWSQIAENLIQMCLAEPFESSAGSDLSMQ